MAEKQKMEIQKEKKIVNIGESQCEFPTFSYFPLEKWKEYDADVRDNYGNIRWAKAWHDHLIVKQKAKEDFMLDLIIGLKHEVEMVKMQVENKNEKQKPQVVKTLGGEIRGD